jgi:hypothetical protein
MAPATWTNVSGRCTVAQTAAAGAFRAVWTVIDFI